MRVRILFARYAWVSALTILVLGLVGAGPIAAGSPLGNGLVQSITVASRSGDFSSPLDSTPDPDGHTIYFSATSRQGPGVFKVDANGGKVVPVATGAPFVAPRGIAMGAESDVVYVTDPQARAARGRTGQLFAVPLRHNGRPTALAGAVGTAPQGLTVVTQGRRDIVYFTGRDPANGRPAVFMLREDRQSAAILAEGGPLVAPDGIAVTHDGTVYVTDRAAAGGNLGSVFRLAHGRLTKIADHVLMGDPAGAALTLDDSVLLVSSRDVNAGTDQVLLINLATLDTGLVTMVVSANHAGGGVHRAYNTNIFSWADLTAGAAGTVYRIKLN